MRSPAETAIGAHAALAAISEHVSGCDAVVLAAFGDYGLTPARDLFAVPIVGIAEAALTVAALAGKPFAILTIGAVIVPALRRLVAEHRLESRLTGIHFAAPLADAGAYAAAAAEVCAAALANERPELFVVAGPPLAAIHDALQQRVAVPILEGVSCAVRLAEAMVALGIGRGSASQANTIVSTREIVGITPALAQAIRRRYP
jgi:Asp/Glu/hydantoin racemase